MSAFSGHWKQLKPAEHGSWSLLLMPFLIGLGMAAQTVDVDGQGWLSLALFMVLALAGFLIRQPLGTLGRIGRGRGRRAGTRLAVVWVAILGVVAALTGVGLLALGREALIVMLGPAAVVLGLVVVIQLVVGPRGLGLELIGALGLALAAPGAYGALSEGLDRLAVVGWGIGAAHSVLAVLYVRLRIDTLHDRVSTISRVGVALAHVVGFGVAVVAGLAGWLPLLVALPFGWLLLRALWVSWRLPPLEDVRRFGFTEMGLSLVLVVLVVVAYG